MISRNFYLQLLVRVLLLVSVAFAASWVLLEKCWISLFLLLTIFEVLLVINLIFYLNKTNRRLLYFFDAIRNEDSMLSFPEKSNDKIAMELNKSLNKVNQQIQQIKIVNRQQEQYFQALLEHAASGIMAIDNRGFILHCNTAVKKYFAVEVLTHLNQLERVDKKLYQTLKNIRSSEQKLITINNERNTIQLSVKASSFITNGNELTLLSVQDIRNELDEKELDSWLKLIRVLMHEIMNSITPITSISESLSRIYTANEKSIQSGEIDEKIIGTTIRGLNVIKEQGNGLISFVESYRKLTRLPKPDKKIFILANLLNRVNELYHSIPGSQHIKLNISLDSPKMELFGDENLISQVLINLIKNALEANGNNPQGNIQITARLISNNRTEICIADNGPGIPAEIMDQIFIPFFTTRENGSGIGLSLSKQIIRLHGGTLQVRSIPNKETAFSIKL